MANIRNQTTEDRYDRNILIEGFGEEGQSKLKNAKVLVVGAGGLGSPVLFYLAAAGVGTIGIVDHDTVNVSNLQRQILHRSDDIGREKVDSACEKLAALNPATGLLVYPETFTEANAERIIKGNAPFCKFPDRPDGGAHTSSPASGERNGTGNDRSKEGLPGGYDMVVDCCDNYATKLLINDVCVRMEKPYSHGAVVALRGEVMTYVPGSACYRCIFDTPPEDGVLPTSSQVGILGSVAGLAGSIQATEVIKYLTGMDGLIINRLLIIDAKTMHFFSLKVKKRNACMCGHDLNSYLTALGGKCAGTEWRR
ncbi:MAG: HesA/MoeB/ThiF family protein [Tannerella sp.]|jgi:molybdopterin/thiamine biosynthesis adenylyltransferase|nr:HesA/MoeB/ThiF family protein [Tannerella sp.]